MSATTIDEYIEASAEGVRDHLVRIRQMFHDIAPGVGERIKYQMPAMTLEGHHTLYFAAWKQHIGIYPIPPLTPALEADIAAFRAAKDTLRFPLRRAIPFDLIERLVRELWSDTPS